MPYDPGVTYRGDQYLAQGLSNFGAGLGKALEEFGDEQKRVTAAGKSADAFVQAAPEALQELGHTPESWKNLGARDKASMMGGYLKAQGAKEFMLGLKQKQQQMDEDAALGKAIQAFGQMEQPAASPMEAAEHADPEAAAQQPALGAALGEFGTRRQGYDERLGRALQTPGLGGRGGVRLLQALQEFAPKGMGPNGRVQLDEFDLPFGNRGVAVRGSKQLQILPNPATGVDAEGNIAVGQKRTVGDKTQTWDGKRWVNMPEPPQTRIQIPESFHKFMDEVGTELDASRTAMDDTALSEDRRARSKRNFEAAQSRARTTIDRYFSSGYIDDKQRDRFYQELKLSAPLEKGKQTPPPAEGAAPSAPAGKVKVRKGGADYWLPEAQVEAAKQQGYEVVK